MGSKPDITFRLTRKRDLPLFTQWLLAPQILAAFPMENQKEVEHAVRLWQHYMALGLSITVLHKKRPVGAANLYLNEVKKLAHQSLFVILVKESHRGQGIGTLLLKEIQQLGRRRGVRTLHLEVYEKNPALRFYKRLGFKEYGKHDRYLKDAQGNYYNKTLMQMKL